LHRGFEKMCEQGTWTQCIPYTDRLNYASPLINNFLFAEAVERMLGVTVPERCSYIRVILSEVSRIADHLTCLGMAAAELGAITVGFYTNEARELLYNINQDVTGARLTVSYGRVGGLARDLPPDFADRMGAALTKIRETLSDTEKLLERNRIFIDRMVGVGLMTPEDAVSYGLTGPLLRATGVKRDLRKDDPYMVYDRFDFDVPVGTKGDNFDRFSVRFEEIRQSMRIIEQALRTLPAGPVSIDDHTIVLPEKRDVYENIEGLMAQFKLVIEGIRVPAGEIYFAGEAANGELGFFIVSDGSGRPYRVRVRPPCFYGMGSVERMVKGYAVADLVATFGMVNMIGGECDR
ncbi:MAG TPA: NADH-quinone oxidoreductase subunit D, partial [Candidatus Binatia bacterium]|nr:NADH-quinone oxidoreductase subunit D [Candidatus Binatia bacterium]